VTATTDTQRSDLTITETRSVAVVMPIPNDPDWALFDEIPGDIPIIVADDSDGKLMAPPRDNVRYFDYAAQRELMGEHYPAIPHKSAAARNFGHVVAYREGYDVVIALDYDCRPAPGWLETHLEALSLAVEAPALRGHWVNSITADGFYARGYPYEYRNAEASRVEDTTATGEVKLNMGVWNNVLDLNGVDKLPADPPYDPGVRDGSNRIALGMLPLCGMNTAFTADLTPAYFFLPDVWVDGWQLSRHDDIWGGYVLQRLMATRGDLVAFGNPVVEHTRQTKLERVVMLEQWMHMMSVQFYDAVDAAAEHVSAGEYSTMFSDFTEAFLAEVTRSRAPLHYRAVYRELGETMQRWAAVFNG
jgi:reversibly glycosylated polypeptide